MDLENGQDALDLMSNIDTEPVTKTQEPATQEPVQEPTTQPVTQPTQELSEVDSLKQKVNELQRVIASDPYLRAQYARAKYGDGTQFQQEQYQPQYTPEQYAQYQQEQQAQQGLPFQPDEYDFTSLEHQTALINHLLQQQLQPFKQYIESVQQEEQMQLRQQAYQKVQELDAGINDQFEKVLPGYKEWFQQDTEESEVLGDIVSIQFEKALNELCPDSRHWHNPKLHADVVSKIAPKIQRLATKLGFQITTPDNTAVKAKAKETFVEGSNAIPASSGGNAFEKALESGNLAEAMAALVS